MRRARDLKENDLLVQWSLELKELYKRRAWLLDHETGNRLANKLGHVDDLIRRKAWDIAHHTLELDRIIKGVNREMKQFFEQWERTDEI